MRFSSAFGALAATFAVVSAQQASDSDVALAGNVVLDVINAVDQLDYAVTNYTGPADNFTLQAASENVILTLFFAAEVVSPLGPITLDQALGTSNLAVNTLDLNNAVYQATQDAQNQAQLFASSCIIPTLLDQLNDQLTAATAFRSALLDKFNATNGDRDLAASISTAPLDDLNATITFFQNITQPANCTGVVEPPANTVNTSLTNVALIADLLQDVVSTVGELDVAINSYNVCADNATFLAASQNVILTLDFAASIVTPIDGMISLDVALGFDNSILPINVLALNSIVDTAVLDVIDRQSYFVSHCLGPTILDQLNEQLLAATNFRGAVTDKFNATNGDRDLALSLSEEAIDDLNSAIAAYANETTIPSNCTCQSTATTTSSSLPGTSVPTSSRLSTGVTPTTSSMPGTSVRTTSSRVSGGTSVRTTKSRGTSAQTTSSSAPGTSVKTTSSSGPGTSVKSKSSSSSAPGTSVKTSSSPAPGTSVKTSSSPAPGTSVKTSSSSSSTYTVNPVTGSTSTSASGKPPTTSPPYATSKPTTKSTRPPYQTSSTSGQVGPTGSCPPASTITDTVTSISTTGGLCPPPYGVTETITTTVTTGGSCPPPYGGSTVTVTSTITTGTTDTVTDTITTGGATITSTVTETDTETQTETDVTTATATVSYVSYVTNTATVTDTATITTTNYRNATATVTSVVTSTINDSPTATVTDTVTDTVTNVVTSVMTKTKHKTITSVVTSATTVTAPCSTTTTKGGWNPPGYGNGRGRPYA